MASSETSTVDQQPDQRPHTARLDDAAVEDRLARLDELLGHLEQYPGPTADAARDAVAALTDVYGEALARVVDRAGQAMAERLANDELLGHLLVMHDIHPEDVEARVRRAVDGVRPYAEAAGGEVEFVEIDGNVARVRLSSGGGGCGCSSAGSSDTLEQAVREAVLALAPELAAVEPVPEPDGEQEPSVIPVEALFVRSATARSGT